MNNGFMRVEINTDEVDKLLKKYKKIKKYMKSSIYEILTIDNNEKIVSELLNENLPKEDPPDSGVN